MNDERSEKLLSHSPSIPLVILLLPSWLQDASFILFHGRLCLLWLFEVNEFDLARDKTTFICFDKRIFAGKFHYSSYLHVDRFKNWCWYMFT
jgi:hypothetical protein